MAARNPLLSPEQIEQAILLIRGQRVMLDSDLAALYGVETFNLNKAVKRNLDRFPADFMFLLTKEEADDLRFQFGISKKPGRGGRRYLPFVFTEQGVAMLSSVLRSKKAVNVNIEIMRAFVRLRHALAANAELARRVDGHEARLDEHDRQFVEVVKYIRKLTESPPAPPRRRIGFQATPDDESANEPQRSPSQAGRMRRKKSAARRS